MPIKLTPEIARKICTVVELNFLERNKLFGMPRLLGLWDNVRNLTMLNTFPLQSILHKYQSCRLNSKGKVEYFKNLKGVEIHINYGPDLREESRIIKHVGKPAIQEFVVRNSEGKIVTDRSASMVYLHDWNDEGRITCIVTYSAETGMTRKTFYEHDRQGNMDRIIREDGTVAMRKAFDSRGNRIYQASSKGLRVWNTYDERNNLIATRDSDGRSGWATYDSHNNVLTSGGNLPNSLRTSVANRYEYYPNGQLRSQNGFIITLLGETNDRHS